MLLESLLGRPVFAVDRSGEMLRLARRNCRSESICFLQQDIRCLVLPSRVDLIAANFDTLNHLTAPEDSRLAFQCIASNLRPAGHFYFDILTPCQPLRGLAYLRNCCTTGHWLRQQGRWEPRRRLMHINAVHRRSGVRTLERENNRACLRRGGARKMAFGVRVPHSWGP